MSVCNISFSSDRVWLLTDSLHYRGSTLEPCGMGQGKTVAGDGFVLATRGCVALCDCVGRYLVPDSPDLAAPKGFMSAVARARVLLSDLGDELSSRRLTGHLGVEVTIAGPHEGVLNVWLVSLPKGGFEPELKVLEHGTHVFPGSPNLMAIPPDITESQFIRLALVQWRIMDKYFTKFRVGGVMHMTAIDRDGVTESRIVGLYPDYDQHAARFGDPSAQDVAAWRDAQALECVA